MTAGALLTIKVQVPTGRVLRMGNPEMMQIKVDILVDKVLELCNTRLIEAYCV